MLGSLLDGIIIAAVTWYFLHVVCKKLSDIDKIVKISMFGGEEDANNLTANQRPGN